MRRPAVLAVTTLLTAAGMVGLAPAAAADSLGLIPQQGRRIADPAPYPPVLVPRAGGIDVVVPPGSADLLGINCYACRVSLGPITFLMPTENIWNP